jgi:hypothetical protein
MPTTREIIYSTLYRLNCLIPPELIKIILEYVEFSKILIKRFPIGLHKNIFQLSNGTILTFKYKEPYYDSKPDGVMNWTINQDFSLTGKHVIENKRTYNGAVNTHINSEVLLYGNKGIELYDIEENENVKGIDTVKSASSTWKQTSVFCGDVGNLIKLRLYTYIFTSKIIVKSTSYPYSDISKHYLHRFSYLDKKNISRHELKHPIKLLTHISDDMYIFIEQYDVERIPDRVYYVLCLQSFNSKTLSKKDEFLGRAYMIERVSESTFIVLDENGFFIYDIEFRLINHLRSSETYSSPFIYLPFHQSILTCTDNKLFLIDTIDKSTRDICGIYSSAQKFIQLQGGKFDGSLLYSQGDEIVLLQV